MEGDDFSLDTNFGSFSDAMELDLMEDLFLDGCWLEATEGNSFNFGTSLISAFPDSKTNHFGTNPQQKIDVDETHFTKLEPLDSSTTLGQSQILLDVEGPDLGTSLWIGPESSLGPSSSSVKERLFQALEFIQELMQDRDILIQIWVPVKRGDKSFLTTKKQPHSYKQNCSSLEKYRHVSEGYNFPADEGSEESVGLPGRVFLAKLPEWTPDVRYFKCEEYPRIKFAQEYDVRGSLALPVFERGNGTCQGVVEIVTTTQQINYRPELENICKALEAVDLRSSNNPSPIFKETPQLQNEPYQTELPEISKVLESVCRANGLPLALTWAPCVRQGKTGSRHSEQNYMLCVSTIDSACFVPDEDSQSFLGACSEHHLLQGEGIVGRAFKTNRQCFATDITAFSRTNYPLAHHAKVFGLHSGLAIPLRGIYTGLVELVLEMFLPKDCIETECQRQMLNSLTKAMQKNFKSSYLVMDKELEEEVILPVRKTMVFSDGIQENQETRSSSLKEILSDESSWIAHMMEANQKGKGVSLSWEYQTEELKDEFKLINTSINSQIDSELVEIQKDLVPKSNKSIVTGDCESLGCRKPGEKRRTKTEKTISLEVIRQYFAGSLKDAAKSLGVCPTTLKRICRQHGIARWPSRKIKKVDHSLKKLQLVIDSVQGIEGSIQLGSFYTNFPDLSSPNFSGADSSSKIPEQSEQSQEAPKTRSSSCNQSSWSKTGKSSDKENALSSRNSLAAKNPNELLKKARTAAELHAMNQDETKVLARTQSHNTLGENLRCESVAPGAPLQQKQVRNLKCRNTVEVKAVFGETKVLFSLQQNWSIRDLQEKIAKCFNIDDISTFDLKYLDDDREWVLLTCDADFDECIDIYRSSQSRRIKIAVQQASQTKLGSSFGSRCKS